jgi:hypothetical protein
VPLGQPAKCFDQLVVQGGEEPEMTLFRCAFLTGCAMCTWLAIGFVIHHKFHKPSLQRIDLKSSLTDHTVIFAAFLYCLRTSADLRFLTRALRAAIGAFGHASKTAALIV